MPRHKLAKIGILLLAILLGGGLDQWLKDYLEFLRLGEVKWGPAKLLWHTNPGIAFSIDLPIMVAVSLVIILLIILLGLWWNSRSNTKVYDIGLVLVISGGMSNLWDKLHWGFVRDFVSIWILPVFNLADVLIFGGIIMIIIGVIYGERHQKI